jgi:hypothetical protein
MSTLTPENRVIRSLALALTIVCDLYRCAVSFPICPDHAPVGDVLRHVRGQIHLPQLLHETRRVIAAIHAEPVFAKSP